MRTRGKAYFIAATSSLGCGHIEVVVVGWEGFSKETSSELPASKSRVRVGVVHFGLF